VRRLRDVAGVAARTLMSLEMRSATLVKNTDTVLRAADERQAIAIVLQNS
jgi:hypothetical protein